jgi:BCD family chlorophyll transporter-like MFS transporter
MATTAMTPSDKQIQVTSLPEQVESKESVLPYSVLRILRLSTFQIGSAMGDILMGGIWNRIMISDFGIPAWPVTFLVAFRYLLAPVTLWIGHRSDTQKLLGYYRTSYIWLGRGVMVLSFPILGASTVRLESNTTDPVGWIMAGLCFLLYGVGTLFSGSPFLALVRDSAPREKQGLAIGIVQTVLIILFPVVAIGFGRMLETYDSTMFWRLILFVALVGAFFWWFGVVGIEKTNLRHGVAPKPSKRIDLRGTLDMIWGDSRTRLFFAVLFVATYSAWMQEGILEPYGADVFDMNIKGTTQLTAWWGTATVIVLVLAFFVRRKRPPEEQAGAARTGLIIMALGMAFLVGSTLAIRMDIFRIGLIVFGAGFGLYSFGGFSLMAVMSPAPNSGAYLGLWTIAVLVSRGVGTFTGGVFRDLFLAMNLTAGLAYGLVFLFSAIGLLVAASLVSGLDAIGFAREHEGPDGGEEGQLTTSS